jgi:hypothetical protein
MPIVGTSEGQGVDVAHLTALLVLKRRSEASSDAVSVLEYEVGVCGHRANYSAVGISRVTVG